MRSRPTRASSPPSATPPRRGPSARRRSRRRRRAKSSTPTWQRRYKNFSLPSWRHDVLTKDAQLNGIQHVGFTWVFCIFYRDADCCLFITLLSIVILNAIRLIVVMLNAIMLGVVRLNVAILSVVMRNVFIRNVLALTS
jgi:hypothetical protein